MKKFFLKRYREEQVLSYISIILSTIILIICILIDLGYPAILFYTFTIFILPITLIGFNIDFKYWYLITPYKISNRELKNIYFFECYYYFRYKKDLVQFKLMVE